VAFLGGFSLQILPVRSPEDGPELQTIPSEGGSDAVTQNDQGGDQLNRCPKRKRRQPSDLEGPEGRRKCETPGAREAGRHHQGSVKPPEPSKDEDMEWNIPGDGGRAKIKKGAARAAPLNLPSRPI
jgi:hypothetical protein